jgi:hypothetical protein
MPFTQFDGYPGCSYKIGYTLFDLSGKRVRIDPKEHGTVKEKVLRYFSDLLKKTGEVQQVETVLIERQDITLLGKSSTHARSMSSPLKMQMALTLRVGCTI